jgi:tripartite-type tricarboxylate transporter receptor subunit TctC
MGYCIGVTRLISAIVSMRRLLIVLLFAGATGLLGSLGYGQTATPGAGQAFPGKPIRIVTSDAGGGSDIVARSIAQGITAPLGQPVIVENRAGGVIAGEMVSKAAPDGHTLLYYGNTLWLLPLMRSNVPYDTLRDFSPITLGVISPSVLAVHPSLPVKSVKELIAMAKARPGQLDYGSPAAGTSTHLAAELLKSMAGIQIVRIPYKGGGATLNDLIAGQIHMAFLIATSVSPHLKSGRLRALGVTGSEPTPQLPGVPTMASTGLPGYESLAITGMFAPAKTPEAIINRLNQEIVRVLHRPDLREKFLGIGVEAVGGSPEQFAAKIRSEIVKWGKIIRDAGIRDE